MHRALARSSLALAQAYYSLWVLGARAIAELGTDPQCEEWLTRLAAGDAKIAFALTEPGSGSDAAALRTTAARSGDRFRVDGQKVFVTGAVVADRIITAVRTTSDLQDRREGISLLLIDPQAAGVTIRPLSKLGLKALDLCEVFLEDVEVPVEDVLGPLDGGWKGTRGSLAAERLLLAAICVGAMEEVLNVSTEYANERVAFGQPIGRFQIVEEKLVNMRVALEASDLLVRRAAASIDGDKPSAPVEAAIAKLHASSSRTKRTETTTR